LQVQATAAQGATNALQVQVTALQGATNALHGKLIAQADTNATTTATHYTPRFVGDVLLGFAGEGTNAVWIGKGATTNDWVAVKP